MPQSAGGAGLPPLLSAAALLIRSSIRGIELWKRGNRGRTELDTAVGSSRVTPRAILETLVGAADQLRLPHAAHIHCNNLGVAGNVTTTLDSMRAVDGRRAHFTHLQFHSYGTGADGRWRSAAREVAEYINAHPQVSGDVGQVMFGAAATLTADGPVEYLLHKSTGRKWVNVDVELETGCGIVPYTYKERSAIAALQWRWGSSCFCLQRSVARRALHRSSQRGSFLSYRAVFGCWMIGRIGMTARARESDTACRQWLPTASRANTPSRKSPS